MQDAARDEPARRGRLAVTVVARARAVLAPHIREEDLGKAAIAVTLALLTVLAATVAGLQGHASTEAQRARREADRIGLMATGEDGSAVVRAGTAYGVYRRWFEELERANWATDQLTRDPDRADKTLLEALAAEDTSTASWIESQTSLLQAPYYDRDTRISDFAAFEADRLNAPATRAAEQRRVEADVSAAWDAKASDYITVLTLLAVGLFFLGLGSTIGGRPRAFLSLAGTAFGAVSLAWTVAIVLGPIHRVPATAIERAVESEAEQIRANGATRPGAEVTTAARQHYVNAVNTATDALTIDPTYVTGYRMRATALLVYADTLIFSPEGPSQTTTDLLRHAVDDYRVYVAGRPDDYAGWWNLGWAAYLLGDVPGSLEATNRALALAPTQFTLYLNRTLALLASRDQDAALADVRQAIDLAARDSTASAVWYLGQSDFNIGRLAELHPEHAATLLAIQTQLRESQVSLRALSQPAPRAGAPQLGSVSVTPVELGRYSGGEFTELEPLTAGASIEAPEAVGFRVRLAAPRRWRATPSRPGCGSTGSRARTTRSIARSRPTRPTRSRSSWSTRTAGQASTSTPAPTSSSSSWTVRPGTTSRGRSRRARRRRSTRPPPGPSTTDCSRTASRAIRRQPRAPRRSTSARPPMRTAPSSS